MWASPYLAKANHHNYYLIELKDKDSHDKIYPGNPTKDDKPYDFNLKFIRQVTVYRDTGKQEDTTTHAYDSFAGCYQSPVRIADFKSALWKKNHEHDVNYIFKIDFDGQLHVLDARDLTEKRFTLVTDGADYLLNRYLELLTLIKEDKLTYFTWDNFILND